MSELAPEEFASFFEAIHDDREPFPWQRRLAARVIEKGWPRALDVPTGAGKTAAIDIAVFHLALEADLGADRTAPLRIIFVVDRRLVVDDAHRRALKIEEKLATAQGGILKRVADKLRGLATGAGDSDPAKVSPLVVSRLRGGTPREADWARSPAQPTVVVSTVDQAGSRLLFRGYGVSSRMRPIHAGLLGTDALFLLDEAHLSRPLVETVQAIRAQDNSAKTLLTCTLSATQPDEAPLLVKSDDLQHRILGPRLQASKSVELITASDEDDLEAKLVEKAWSLSICGGGSAQLVGVVVNRVRRARAIRELLARKAGLGPQRAADVELLTGRVRSIERDETLKQLLPRMAAERKEATGLPLLVVATQCIEAGADLDFDALVTELAPLDCLRQRFGRLNRMGRKIPADGAVIAVRTHVSASAKPDPIYETAHARTWDLVSSVAKKVGKGKDAQLRIDFGIEAAKEWLPPHKELENLVAPRARAPLLTPMFLDRWSMTSPAPASEPEIGLFLHGPRAGPAEVQLIWRLELADPDRKPSDSELARIVERLAACPPSTPEAMPLPFIEARRWLGGQRGSDFGDLEQSPPLEPDEQEPRKTERWALRWRGPDDPHTEVVDARSIRPGDLLIVPAALGGCDEWGWNPSHKRPVRDLGLEANLQQRGKMIVRLAKDVFEQAVAETLERAPRLGHLWSAAVEAARDLDGQDAGAELAAVPDLPEPFATAASNLRDDVGSARLLRAAEGSAMAIVWQEEPAARDQARGDSTTEDDSSSIGLRPVPLAKHSDGVRSFAKGFADKSGLDPSVAKDVAIAGYLHDAGKGHPEFKCWLYGGNELAAKTGEALAKSGRVRLGSRARRLAGLPDGARHEVASLAFALAHPMLREANDPDLVLWLVGTHHGWGRPFFPPVEWPVKRSFRVDLGDGERESTEPLQLARLLARWIDLQGELTKKYGYWGLARLEAVVRLADHRCSDHEQRRKERRHHD